MEPDDKLSRFGDDDNETGWSGTEQRCSGTTDDVGITIGDTDATEVVSGEGESTGDDDKTGAVGIDDENDATSESGDVDDCGSIESND